MLLGLVQNNGLNDASRSDFTRHLIQAGVLPDEDGSICMAFVGKDCPLKVLKPN